MVGLGVVGEHALDDDALLAVPDTGAAQEGSALLLALGAQDLAVGKPRVVVDRHVQVLPAGPAGAVDPVFADALADLEEASELLRVHVQELARALALVADARIAAGARQARAACPAQHLVHGR